MMFSSQKKKLSPLRLFFKWGAFTTRWQYWSRMKSCLLRFLTRSFFSKQNKTSFIRYQYCHLAGDGSLLSWFDSGPLLPLVYTRQLIQFTTHTLIINKLCNEMIKYTLIHVQGFEPTTYGLMYNASTFPPRWTTLLLVVANKLTGTCCLWFGAAQPWKIDSPTSCLQQLTSTNSPINIKVVCLGRVVCESFCSREIILVWS